MLKSRLSVTLLSNTQLRQSMMDFSRVLIGNNSETNVNQIGI